MAEDTVRKAKAKVAEKEEAIEALDRSVRRMELVLARTVEKVKEEEEDEVVEVEVEAEDMEEGMVKEEVEAKVVVEAPAGGGDEPVAQADEGVEGFGGHLGPAMGPGCRGWPPRPKAGHPPPRRPGLDSPVFVAAGAPPAVLGGGWVCMDDGGGCPCGQAPAPRGGQRVVGVATRVAGAGEEMGGGVPPPPLKWG